MNLKNRLAVRALGAGWLASWPLGPLVPTSGRSLLDYYSKILNGFCIAGTAHYFSTRSICEGASLQDLCGTEMVIRPVLPESLQTKSFPRKMSLVRKCDVHLQGKNRCSLLLELLNECSAQKPSG